jgi:hypothetical protein
VHGDSVEQSALAAAFPFAEEAPRRVWKWYFEKLRREKSNVRGVAQIDDELVGPRVIYSAKQSESTRLTW